MKKKFDISEFVNAPTEQSVTEDLVTRFKQRRKEYGITQKDLSTRSGVSYASIRRFENSGEISLSSLVKISHAIDCLEDFNELYKNKIIKNLKDFGS
ncbi:MAG: helix-turn-helix transcriptional regulator [Clostridia bacterium]